MGSPVFRIDLLPAKHGDGIWIEYSAGDRTRRVVIDGGPVNAFGDFNQRFVRLPAGDTRVELFVVTHVDADHIEAPVRLLAHGRARWPFAPSEIWFNGYRHMTAACADRSLGARDGDFLSALLQRDAGSRWNTAFAGDAVAVGHGRLPEIGLADGMTLTLLSPGCTELHRMAEVWKEKVRDWPAGDLQRALEVLADERKYRVSDGVLGPEDISKTLRAQLKPDQAKANGSSIAFLAEFRGKSCLLLADAHMKRVCASLRTLLKQRGQERLEVDAVKVSHHGSKRNISAALFELVDAEHFLISTNGDKHGHPDAAAIEAIIAGASRKPTIWFNYRSASTQPWEAGSLGAGAKYATRYPSAAAGGIALDLL